MLTRGSFVHGRLVETGCFRWINLPVVSVAWFICSTISTGGVVLQLECILCLHWRNAFILWACELLIGCASSTGRRGRTELYTNRGANFRPDIETLVHPGCEVDHIANNWSTGEYNAFCSSSTAGLCRRRWYRFRLHYACQIISFWMDSVWV